MGAWGHDVLENDDAMDVIDTMNRYMSDGLNIFEATEKFKQEKGYFFDYPESIFGLAHKQMEFKTLDTDVYQKTLQSINDKDRLTDWNDPNLRKQHMLAFKGRMDKLLQGKRIVSLSGKYYVANGKEVDFDKPFDTYDEAVKSL